MSFWHTFVGKAIHRVSFGTIGQDSSHHPAPAPSGQSTVASVETESKCASDFKYYMDNPQVCLTAGTNSGHVPTPDTGIQYPVAPTGIASAPIELSPSTPSSLGPSGPVSAVPEPSSIMMVCTGLVIVAMLGYAKRRR